MKVSSAFPSKYLRATDLDGRLVTVEISHVDMEDVATGEEPKPVLYFAGKSKGVVLNKTNANTISMAYGDESDEWAGQPVVLYSAHVDFQGRSVEAIRMKIPPRKPAGKTTVTSGPQAPPPPPVVLDEDIPF